MKTTTPAMRKTPIILACFVLFLMCAVMANAQITTGNANTTTTLWAGTADSLQFGVASLTGPTSGVILQGTAISAITGNPVRHLWYGDEILGLCRIDPELDAVIEPALGIGGHFAATATCVGSIQGAAFTPSQLAFDASTNTLYTADARFNFVFRLPYLPSGDNGQGAIDALHIATLIGSTSARANVCGGVKDPKTGTLVPAAPNSAAIGPDGNLYVGSTRDGAIIRFIGPATFNPGTDCPASNQPQPSDKIQIPILSADEQFGSGHTFGLGWVGNSLFGADNIAPWILTNAAQCFTAVNGNKICGSPALGGQAQMPIEVLASFFVVAGPQGGAISDAQYPAFSGTTAYVAAFPNLVKVTNIQNASTMTVQANYGGSFAFITGMTADPTNSQVLYVGSDPTQGGITGDAAIYQVTPSCPAAPPLAPSAISAAASATTTGAASVSWVATTSCNAATSYAVRTLLAPALPGGTPSPSTVADVTVAAPATSTSVSGLTVGTSYVFEVEACNATGCSAFSPVSNVITAAAAVPPVVSNVVAIDSGTGASASVAWSVTSAASVTSSTVSAFDTLTPTVATSTATIIGSATGATVGGLSCGHSYTFTVTATSVVGTGAASAPSLPIAIACQTAADVAVTVTSPASVNAGSLVTFSMSIHNGGPAGAPQVTLSDTLPAPLSSFTSSQGTCALAPGTVLSCNLGSMAAGASATVTATVQLPATQTGTLTNTATVSALDAGGANIDPNLANNTASATITPVPACATSTTDIQVTGSAQNGNPVHGTRDVFTWQIKNNLGTVAANCVTFSVTTTAPAGGVLAVNATNPGASATPPSCSFATTTVSCSLGSIAGGSTAIVTVTATPSAAAAANSYSMTGSAQLGLGSTDTNTANNSFKVSIGAQ